MSRVVNASENELHELATRDFVMQIELEGLFEMVISTEPAMGLGAKWFDGKPLIKRWLDEAFAQWIRRQSGHDLTLIDTDKKPAYEGFAVPERSMLHARDKLI